MIYISPKACQYLVSTRINRIETETVFPCPPFLLFVLSLLSHSSWKLCSNRSWSNYYWSIAGHRAQGVPRHRVRVPQSGDVGANVPQRHGRRAPEPRVQMLLAGVERTIDCVSLRLRQRIPRVVKPGLHLRGARCEAVRLAHSFSKCISA